MLRALGGNAFLQVAESYVSFFPESTDDVPLVGESILTPMKGMVKKINAGMLFAGSARSLDIPVKTAFGQSTTDELTFHVKRMQIAMLNDDQSEFNKAYKNAIQSAINLKKPDPAKAVRDRWGGRNPLFLIQTKSEAVANMDRLLKNMPSEYRSSAVQALNLYEKYSVAIGANGNFQTTNSVKSEDTLRREVIENINRRQSRRGRSALSGLQGLRGL